MKRLLRALCLVSIIVLLSACQPERGRPVEPMAHTPFPELTITSAPERTPTTRSTAQVDIRTPAEARQAVVVSPVGADGRLVEGTDGMPWWNDTIFYEVFVRSFSDSDGDGIGDLRGLVEKLDYLNDGDPVTSDDLGVTGIWLMPIQQSPSYHGYDVEDYYTVDHEYGSNEDFLALVEEAHARGIRVIVDLVLNHTSSQHPWFVEAQDPTSSRRDWYVWKDSRPSGRGWHEHATGYYYGYFWGGMPDLNYGNPQVTEAMYEVARFWLQEMQVDGFRLDAIKYLIEDQTAVEHTPATLAWLTDFAGFRRGIAPKSVAVGEVWGFTDDVAVYVGDRLDLAFEFYLAAATLESAGGGHNGNVTRAQQLVMDYYPPGQYATFLSNHDQNRTRSRLISDDQAKVAATLQLTFAGVPFIYYGEEIGMKGIKPDEDIRRPMQWQVGGGFSSATPWRPYPNDYSERNVEIQTITPDSLINHYRELIRLRNTHEALRVGDWLPIDTGLHGLYASLRYSGDEILLVLANLRAQPVTEYELTLPSGPLSAGLQPVLLAGAGTLHAPQVNPDGGFDRYQPLEIIPPYASIILQFVP